MQRRERDRTLLPLVLTMFVILAAAAGLYLAGYLVLGREWVPGLGGRLRMRVFDHEALAVLYRPASWVESQIRGYDVSVGTEPDLMRASP